MKKERIKDRMLKTTARLWGVPENEIETHFDPLILLLIEACAAEMEKIGYDINASHTRLLDRLADMVVPESAIGPKPASAVITATPVEANAILEPLTRFYTNQRIVTPETGNAHNTDLFFTPVGKFPVLKVSFDYMFAGNKLYRINENNSRDVVHEGDREGNVHELWLALTPDKALPSLRGLSIYFDLRSHSEAGNFYKSLENAAAWAGAQNLGLEPGYYQGDQFELSPEEMLVAGHDYGKKVSRQIAGIYQKHFLHLTGNQPMASLTEGGVPEGLKQQLPQQVAQQLASEPMVFIRIALSRPFHQDVLNGLFCSINAFPVINRKYNTANYRTDTWINIIPLQIEGSFFDLHDITSATGKKYKFRTTADQNAIEEGEASVRSSGIGKTNSKEVREIINSLMEAIRDESAYFSELSNEFITARLREISQILARLEDQLAAARDSHAPHHYILLRPKNAGDQVTINYWTTNAADANQVKAGTSMNAFNHTLVGAKNAYMVTNAVGGKSGVTEAEKKHLLKQQLASNGRIISAEDVKLLCAQLFGSRLKRVEVKKGVQVGNVKAEGFIRTIDVLLTLSNEAKEKKDNEITYLCSELEYQLQQNATPIYPFRIVVN